MRLLIFTAIISATFWGCTHGPKISSERQSSQLYWNVNWVKTTVQGEHTKFRKINRFMPLIGKKNLVVGNSLDGVSAFDKVSGLKLWTYQNKNGAETTGALVKDLVFFGDNDGQFRCLSVTDGSQKWSRNLESEILAPPSLVEDKLFIQTGTGSVFAMDAVTGKSLWSFNKTDTSSLTVRGASKPLYFEGSVYIGFADGTLVKLDAETGKQQWEILLNKSDKFRDLDSGLVVFKGSLIVSGFDDKIYSVDSKTGQVVWEVPGGGAFDPVLDKGFLYISASDGHLQKLDASNGKLLWKQKFNRGLPGQPLILNSYIVVGESSGSLHLLSKETGKSLNSFDPGRGIFSAPALDLDSGSIYFISGEGHLYSMSLKSGSYYDRGGLF